MTNIIDLYNRRLERRAAAALADPVESLVDAGRRSMLARAAVLGTSAVGTAAAMMAPTLAQAQTLTDADVLTFALNLEYLEAEYYLYATTGAGLPDTLTGPSSNSSTTRGTTTGGQAVNFGTDNLARQYANEIANDEMTHVAFLRAALGAAGAPIVARPNLNIAGGANNPNGAFAALFQAAGLGANFDPYASPNNFLLGAFVFEDVGVTAYKGASPLIANKTYLEAAAGILAVEAYHAGLVRTLLYGRGAATSTNGANGTNASLRVAADRIAAARDSVDGSSKDDQGISPGQDPAVTDTDVSNIVPLDANGIAYSRSTNAVLNVVYLNTTATYPKASGGFFPNGLNGTIKSSSAAS